MHWKNINILLSFAVSLLFCYLRKDSALNNQEVNVQLRVALNSLFSCLSLQNDEKH